MQPINDNTKTIEFGIGNRRPLKVTTENINLVFFNNPSVGSKLYSRKPSRPSIITK